VHKWISKGVHIPLLLKSKLVRVNATRDVNEENELKAYGATIIDASCVRLRMRI
jgi:hypothetical protein